MLYNLQKFREEKGFTQLKLAVRSGVSQGTISMIEGGKRVPTVFIAKKLADVLGVTIDEMVVDDGDDDGENPEYEISRPRQK